MSDKEVFIFYSGRRRPARGQQSSNIYTKKARQTTRREDLDLNFTQYIVLYFFNKLIFFSVFYNNNCLFYIMIYDSGM